MIVGMDFGTTNSGMALYDGHRLQPVPFDAAGARPSVDRTALYITNDQSMYAGHEAIDRYLEHNVGRPVKMERVRVGTLEVISAEARYFEDVYTERDIFSPGRLFVSFKTFLSATNFTGTLVGNLYYSLEDIVATYLRLAKLRAERWLGQELREIVLGRPVVFSRDPAGDALARERLVAAALRAGYERVYLQYEPVAAAFHYESSLTREQIVLVFDFGGGTLDVTVIKMGNQRSRTVLATGGIPVAGDIFDQRVVRMKLARLFGEGTTYRSLNGTLPLPSWIYESLSDWQSIVSLQYPENIAMLETILATAEQPQAIRNLIELASSNYGLQLYGAVEEAKRTLSDQAAATITFASPGLALRQPITRWEFEALIDQEITAIAALLDRVVRDAGLAPQDVDAVVRTGGSSQIPVFVQLLGRMFGPEKVHSIDAFSSVTSGLAVAAHRIARGDLEAESYGPQHGAPGASSPSTTPALTVDPIFLSRWVTAQEQAATAPTPSLALTRLTTAGLLLVTQLPHPFPAGKVSLAAPEGGPHTLVPGQAVLCGLDDRLLLITSSFRFLITTPRRLAVLQEAGLDLTRLERLDRGERLCTLDPWSAIKDGALLAVATSYGFVRLLDMDLVRGRLERSIPLMLEQRDESYPVAAFGTCREQEVAVITSTARAVRLRLSTASFLGLQAIKRDKHEHLVGCFAVQDGDEIVLAIAAGLKPVPLAVIPRADEPNTRGKIVTSRTEVYAATVARAGTQLWALTPAALRPLQAQHPATLGQPATRTRGAGAPPTDGPITTLLPGPALAP